MSGIMLVIVYILVMVITRIYFSITKGWSPLFRWGFYILFLINVIARLE